MAILSNGKFYGFLCSAKETGQKLANGAKEYVENFVSGFAGHGWKIWEYVKGKWMLEIDSIRVRGQFTVFEMLISKVRAIIGAQAITQGCGKIKTAELSDDGTAYLITLEDADMSFMEHDFIRCQEFTGSQKVYHVEIESVIDGIIRIPLSEFNLDEAGMVLNPPAPGDDIVQFGNSSHDEKYAGRHSAIYMHADEGLPPAIDVLDEIYSKEDWLDCLKTRLGGDIPGSEGLRGFYSVNGMIKGVDESGHSTYCLFPDGTAELGDSSVLFKPDRSGYIAGGSIAWEWNEEKQKYVVAMDDVQVEWNNVKDSPEWINEWTKGGTTIGGKFVAAPTGFFGVQDEDEKLTGILMGEKVMVNGTERTGIFALVDNKPVFELDPLTRKYSFTGHIETDTGRIGNLVIDGSTLKSNTFSSGIEIEGGTNRFLGLGGLYSSLISMRIDSSDGGRGNKGIGIQSYGKNNVCLDILANAGSKFAIDSVGPHRFYQRSGEIWDAPGVLWAGRFNMNGDIENGWGEGAGSITSSHPSRGNYTIYHEIGHSQYYVMVTAIPYGEDDSGHMIGMILDKGLKYFNVRIVDATRGVRNFAFEVVVFGRNRYNEYYE